ncbi:MAG: hypothetical protein ACT4NP_08625 [Pseudonocardiales bacterium]
MPLVLDGALCGDLRRLCGKGGIPQDGNLPLSLFTQSRDLLRQPVLLILGEHSPDVSAPILGERAFERPRGSDHRSGGCRGRIQLCG